MARKKPGTKPGTKTPSAKQSAAHLEAETRRTEATKLRRQGWTLQEIADKYGVSVVTVHRDIQLVLRRTIEAGVTEMDEHRALELERIDSAIFEVMSILEGRNPESKHSVELAAYETDEDTSVDDALEARAELRLKAVDRLVKLNQERAKLLGLYAPEKQELTGKDGAPLDVSARDLLLERLNGLANREAPPEGEGEVVGEPDGGGGQTPSV